ncbi:MAG: peptide ABC transporter substrate-binding protein [Alphaproteobacteria bacterium]|nr:peptide ABC transporter substrate-binding protein [Alphaproteobacteria bacterium]
MTETNQRSAGAAGVTLSRRAALAAAGGAVLAGLAPGREVRAQARARDQLIFALSSYPPSLRAWANAGTAASTVKLQNLRGLLTFDERGGLRAELAESHRRINPTTWEFTLRDGVKFHDGEKADAGAVKHSFEAMTAERSPAYLRSSLAPLIDKIETPNARTVVFRLREPSATFSQLIACFHAAVISPKSTEANPVGCGPYRITDVERGTRIDFEAYDGYYKPGMPRSKKMRMIAYADENLRVAALEAGDVDIIEYVPWQSMEAIERNQNLKLDSTDGPFMYLVYNVQRGPFTNVKLRQATAYAANRQDIVRAAFFGRGSALEGIPVPASSPYFNRDLSTHWRRDLDKAKRLLAEAGMPNGFEATLLSTAQYGMHKDTAEVVQQSLAQAGIKVTLNLPDWATRVTLGNRGQFDFAVMGSSGLFNDPDALQEFVAGLPQASYNRSFGYRNAKIDELVAKGRAELDEGRRKAIYRELEQIALEDATCVGLAWRSQGYAMQKSVTGFANLPGFLTFHSGATLEAAARG